jgi:hypothetical protein
MFVVPSTSSGSLFLQWFQHGPITFWKFFEIRWCIFVSVSRMHLLLKNGFSIDRIRTILFSVNLNIFGCHNILGEKGKKKRWEICILVKKKLSIIERNELFLSKTINDSRLISYDLNTFHLDSSMRNAIGWDSFKMYY